MDACCRTGKLRTLHQYLRMELEIKERSFNFRTIKTLSKLPKGTVHDASIAVAQESRACGHTIFLNEFVLAYFIMFLQVFTPLKLLKSVGLKPFRNPFLKYTYSDNKKIVNFWNCKRMLVYCSVYLVFGRIN